MGHDRNVSCRVISKNVREIGWVERGKGGMVLRGYVEGGFWYETVWAARDGYEGIVVFRWRRANRGAETGRGAGD